jgi:hypothetical protein
LHPARLIEAIRSGLGDAETTAAEVRAAARVLEASEGLEVVLLATGAAEDLTVVAIDRAARCPAPERDAWLTLAAVGAARARQCLAWRACRVLEVEALASALVGTLRPRRACRVRGRRARAGEERAAWRLLAALDGADLRRLAAAHPVLSGRVRRPSGAGRDAAGGPGAAPALA